MLRSNIEAFIRSSTLKTKKKIQPNLTAVYVYIEESFDEIEVKFIQT